MNMHLISKALIFALVGIGVSPTVFAQVPEHSEQYANAEHVLDGTSFQYFYEDGGGLEIAFYDGMVRYVWIVGPRKGNSAKDILYQSRRIGDNFYLVNWQEQDKPDFVSLIINLRDRVMYSSAILRYTTEQELVHFKKATIREVRRLEN